METKVREQMAELESLLRAYESGQITLRCFVAHARVVVSLMDYALEGEQE